MKNDDRPEIEIYTLKNCPYCRKAKNFLQSKGFTYREYGIEEEKNKREMKERTDGAKTVPQIFIEGQLVGGYDDMIEMKASGELAELLGLDGEDDNFSYERDLVIIGAGPAGLNASLYAARKGLDVLLVSEAMGGQMADTGEVDNYLGINNISGPELLRVFWEHIENYDLDLELGEVVSDVYRDDEGKMVVEGSTGTVWAKAVIAASGADNRELGVSGEKKLKGQGVHYCATCDGYLYSKDPVAVVGGGNSGLEAALDMARLESRVDLIEVQDTLTGDQVLRERVENNDLINIHTATEVLEISGENTVDNLVLRDIKKDSRWELNVKAVFIEIGLIPNTDYLEERIKTNDMGEIVINDSNETSMEGLWAAGDITNIRDKQIIISAAEGAKAALRVNEYLN
ncbi:MAG: glutaredoxin 3 [Halanaerobiaceae bacterium]